MTDKNRLAKAVKALPGMGPVKHERILKPTQADLNRRFRLQPDRKGKPYIKELE